MSNFLRDNIPSGNRIEKAFARGRNDKAALVEADYQSGFVGAFLTTRNSTSANFGSEGWITKVGDYLRDEWLAEKDGPKFLSELTLPRDHRGIYMHHMSALRLWRQCGGVMPYSTAQDYGSCVDASESELETALLGMRIEKLGLREIWNTSAAWWKYSLRGYCSDGWNAWGLLTAAKKCGTAFRQKYQFAGREYDFAGDDENEGLCARTWCRNGPPAEMLTHHRDNHGIDPTKVVEFDGGVEEIVAVCASNGLIHWSGSGGCISGGPKPFTWGSVGPHQMPMYGVDRTEWGRKWALDVCGKRIEEDDAIIHMGNTWATRTGQWSGECADQYWPGNFTGAPAEWRAAWGEKTACSWICSAKEAIRRCSFDMVWFAEAIKGFPGDPLPPPMPVQPKLEGTLYAEQVGSIIAIRGELKLEDKHAYIVVPDGTGTFTTIPKPIV